MRPLRLKYGFPLQELLTIVRNPVTTNARMTKLLVGSGDDWCLIKEEEPVFEAGWEDLYVLMYFPHKDNIRKVVLSKVYASIREQDWCGIISFVTYKLKGKEVSIQIPRQYRRYNVLVGGGRNRRINPQLAIDAFNADTSDEKFVKGLIYAVSNGTKFTPHEILLKNAVWFEPALDASMVDNDCLTHSINYLFRHPIFVMREQVHRLAKKRDKKSSSVVEKRKRSGGYSLSIFADFVVKEGCTYNFVEVLKLDISN